MAISSTQQLMMVSGVPNPIDITTSQNLLMSVIKVVDISKGLNDYQMEISNGFYSIVLTNSPNTEIRSFKRENNSQKHRIGFFPSSQFAEVRQNFNEFSNCTGWLLIFYADILEDNSLAGKIMRSNYFLNKLAKVLPISKSDELFFCEILEKISQEYDAVADNFSQNLIDAQLNLLLTAAEQLYEKQCNAKKSTKSSVPEKLDELLTAYFKDRNLTANGLPKFKYIANELNISSNLLSRLYISLTGNTIEECVKNKIITIAKEKLTTTDLPINEIAHEIGFKYPMPFHRLFKLKTEMTPLQFRRSFNRKRPPF